MGFNQNFMENYKNVNSFKIRYDLTFAFVQPFTSFHSKSNDVINFPYIVKKDPSTRLLGRRGEDNKVEDRRKRKDDWKKYFDGEGRHKIRKIRKIKEKGSKVIYSRLDSILHEQQEERKKEFLKLLLQQEESRNKYKNDKKIRDLIRNKVIRNGSKYDDNYKIEEEDDDDDEREICINRSGEE